MKVTGTDLRAMRLRSGKTTSQMAQYAKVKTRKTYENWEKGMSSPNVNQFLAMAEACGYDVVKLLKLVVERAEGDNTLQVTQAFANGEV